MFDIRPASRDGLSHRLTWPDVAVAVCSSILAPAIWSAGHAPMSYEALARYTAVAIVVSIVVIALSRIGAIAVQYFSTCDAISLLKAAGLSVIVISALHFMINRGDGIGRGLPAFHFFVLSAGLFATRAIAFKSSGRGQRRCGGSRRHENVIVIGASRLAVAFISASGHDPRRRVLAVLDSDDSLLGRSVAGCPVIGKPASLKAVIAEYAVHGVRVDKLFLGVGPEELEPAEANVIKAAAARFDCQVLEQKDAFPGRRDEPEASIYAPQDAALVEHVRSRIIWDLKRLFDVTVALTFLIVLSPFLLFCALFVLGDLGFPAFFLQERLGRDGRPFNVVKFRTMRAGGSTPSYCGAYLRRTRLDELPQLLNVLRGQMSLIGPRPLLATEQSHVSSVRLAALPGLTGWAQVCGANLCAFEEKVALDEWYVRNASLLLDARILFMTVRVVAFGEVRRESDIQAAMAERAARLDPQPLPTAQPSAFGDVRAHMADQPLAHRFG